MAHIANNAVEIQAMVFEEAFEAMKSSPVLVCLPDCPVLPSVTLENVYYPKERNIIDAV